MNKTVCLLILLCNCSFLLKSQVPDSNADTPSNIRFYTYQEENGIRFSPQLPLLTPIPGAPAPFWEYFWIFGDGSFSREESPIHVYQDPGNYDSYLLATGNYDKGEKPKKTGNKVAVAAAGSGLEAFPSVIDNLSKSVGIAAARDPSPNEETFIIISYRNNTQDYQSGKLHFFYNEKRFPDAHFTFQESLTYSGESEAPSAFSYAPNPPFDALRSLAAAGPWLLPPPAAAFSEEPANDRVQVLDGAQEEFRDRQIWNFSNLKPGESRNIFVSLMATPEMVKDTSVTIFLQTAFETIDGNVFDFARLEIEIVAAHDPNVITVSDRKVGFRGIQKNRLNYRTRFQNTGEGPAKTIKITTEIPAGLDVDELEVVDNYPKCPICPKGRFDLSCLDTIIEKDKLIFIFRNVYLPGTRQEGVKDRDSTNGFVYYRILPNKKMKKLPFRSQASIEFDREPPVVTNWAPTRYKYEPSPGIQIGYRTFLDNAGNEPRAEGASPNYFYLGASLSDYKAARIYWQPEIRTGISGRWETPVAGQFQSWSDTISMEIIDEKHQALIIADTSVLTSGSRTLRRHTLELVPVQFRKNFTDFFAVGLGASYILTFEKSAATLSNYMQTSRKLCIVDRMNPDVMMGDCEQLEASQNDFQTTPTTRSVSGALSLFVDVNVGLVRAGPAVGFRNHFRLGNGGRYALEGYLTWKF